MHKESACKFKKCDLLSMTGKLYEDKSGQEKAQQKVFNAIMKYN